MDIHIIATVTVIHITAMVILGTATGHSIPAIILITIITDIRIIITGIRFIHLVTLTAGITSTHFTARLISMADSIDFRRTTADFEWQETPERLLRSGATARCEGEHSAALCGPEVASGAEADFPDTVVVEDTWAGEPGNGLALKRQPA